MIYPHLIFKPRHRLDLVAGICDGILTALTLSAGRLMGESKEPFTLDLAFRIATAGAVSGLFIFFVGHYAELRGRLFEAERQLNITAAGRLATTHLGRNVTMQAAWGAIIGSVCSFGGAFYPVLLAVLFPTIRWIPLAGALAGLAVLGICLAWSVRGNFFLWAGALVLAGIALTLIGFQLKLV